VTLAGDRERISALTAGLAATITAWTFAVGYAPAVLESLTGYSAWFYGPIALAVWAAFTTIAYLLIHRDARRGIPPSSDENYRCGELHIGAPAAGLSVCASRGEKDQLAAVTAGLAFTMTIWVAALSFAPNKWMEALSAEPPWFYFLVSVGLWVSLSFANYPVFRALNRRYPFEFN